MTTPSHHLHDARPFAESPAESRDASPDASPVEAVLKLLQELTAVVVAENQLLKNRQYDALAGVSDQKIGLLDQYRHALTALAACKETLSDANRHQLQSQELQFKQHAARNQILLKAASAACADALNIIIQAGRAMVETDAPYTLTGNLNPPSLTALMTAEEL